MTPERWQQVKEIFNSALMYRPEERGPFILRACSGDENLRSEVESLIASHEQSGSFIDKPAFEAAATLLAGERAELRPGQIIGSYEVISFISRGGMGEVYLAQDKRLGRKVALKLLPSSFTTNDDRLRRFEQEARAASALNHPNIITIYEIREAAGSHVIATEFVEGETLRLRLSRSALTLSEALNVAIQVADALSAAHKAGIIHRDIKPENIMLRPDGYVKVLDFGLAKLSEEASPAVIAEAPTIQVRTGSGMVIGTAGYMSPEQARGLGVDNRSDIFSLGAVIYEMVALRKPFHGETPSDTLASILKTDPPPLSRVVPGVPSELARIVTKALRKDREERYQVVKDLWLDLRALKQELEFQDKLDRSVSSEADETATGAMVPGEPTVALSGPRPTVARSAISNISESISIEIKRHKLGAALALIASVLIVAAGIFVAYKWFNRESPVDHFSDVRLTRLTNSGNAIDATISPDGKYIVYALSDRSRQTSSVSPDGRMIAYTYPESPDPFAPPNRLAVMPFEGGANVKTFDVPSVTGIVLSVTDWSHDGKSILYTVTSNNVSNIWSQPLDGGPLKQVTDFKDLLMTGFDWSQDGKQLACTRGTLVRDAILITDLK